MESYEDRVAVVTGAGSGIGLAIATELAARGARLVLGDIESDALTAAVAGLESTGAEIVGVRGDVSIAADVERLARTAMERFGALHVAVNNAGVAGGGPMWEIEPATWEWVLGVDLWGVIHGVRAFVPRIIESGAGGVVINTASMAGLTSTPFMGPYNVAKHGVVTLSETLHHELSLLHPDIGVTVLCPGWVRTRIHQSERNSPAAVAERQDDVDAVLAGTPLDGMAGMVDELVANGLDPAEVARMTLDAALAGQVYVLTHGDWTNMVTRRTELMVSGRNPEMSFPGND